MLLEVHDKTYTFNLFSWLVNDLYLQLLKDKGGNFGFLTKFVMNGPIRYFFIIFNGLNK